MNKTYRVERIDGRVSCDVDIDGTKDGYALHNVEYHTRDGFDMGDFGWGSHDLALTILLDHFGEKRNRGEPGRGWTLHHPFCWHFITPHKDQTTITTAQIEAWRAEQGHL